MTDWQATLVRFGLATGVGEWRVLLAGWWKAGRDEKKVRREFV
jgi:hypothetical protein